MLHAVVSLDLSLLKWRCMNLISDINVFNSKNGLLGFGTSAITSFSSALQSNNVRHKTMTGREVNEIYSNQLQLPDEYLCIFAEDAGIIRASHAVATLQVSIHRPLLISHHHSYTFTGFTYCGDEAFLPSKSSRPIYWYTLCNYYIPQCNSVCLHMYL